MRFNQVALCGRLVRDAEYKVLQSGTKLLEMRVAFDQGYGDQRTGGFIDVKMFGDRAEKIASWCVKGREVMVAGRLEYREWEAQGGGKRSVIDLVAFDLDFLSVPDRDERAAQQPQEGAFHRPQVPPLPARPEGW